MKKIILKLSVVFMFVLCVSKVFAADASTISADEALQKLKQGNARFVQHHMKHPHETKALRTQLTKAQHPFVAILSCSDSRVPTEIIFDQGLGDIFVIRNAGNVLDEHVLGSIEYAVHHLGVKLLVVLGHESCGAVAAAMKDSEESPAIESLKEAIAPAVEQCKKENNYTSENVIKTHAKMDASDVLKDEELNELVKEHNLKIVPAYYSLTTGKVEFLN